MHAGSASQGTISILIPTYNHAQFIYQTLESIFAQTRQPAEIIVINDGSPDNTHNVIIPYLDRITYIEQENQGVANTLNKGIHLCQGDYLLVIASDDWLTPDALALLAEVLDQDQEIAVAYGKVYRIYENQEVDNQYSHKIHHHGKHKNLKTLLLVNYIPAPTALCRREAVLEAAPFPNYTYCQDWAMWINILLNEWYIYELPQKVAYYRRHDHNISHKSNHEVSLIDNINLIEELKANNIYRLSPDQLTYFAHAYAHFNYLLGLHKLKEQSYQAARKSFIVSLRSKLIPKALLGLILTFLPYNVYLMLKKIKNYSLQRA